ncbi:DNA polymerase III subunit delta [Sphingomonas arenae]|uniref:DNA polymerase III subunit delta n=1 Tax=Sphingomonas arenae TaxID=2812555 RepID=UPI0019675663|nr:DNA polymerase III subunit delta [Sphingomonas arenae]
MKPAKGQIGSAVDRPDPSIRFYLFHGPDEAGSRALAARLLSALGAEKVSIAAGTLKSDPAVLADEAGAISLFGGKRLLWIEPAGNEVVAAVEALLAAPATESAAVAIAGALAKTSALLKLGEAHPAVLAHASYVPEGRDADRMVMEIARREGLRLRPTTASRIAAAAGNDQAIAAQEIAKFALFLGASAENPKDLEEEVVDLLGADSSESQVGRPGDTALSGDVQRLAEELERMAGSGIEPIPAVRALQRRLLQLAPLRARMEAGQAPDAVMTSLFWRDKPLFQKLLSRWSSERIAVALDRVGRLERQLMLNPVPDSAAFGEELIQIARAANAR